MSIKEPFNLEYMTVSLCVFRSAPTKKYEDYIPWMNKIESRMSETKKARGIFDLIQLSRTVLSYCQNMLVVSMYFLEITINTFQLPCGMVTPTLFDITAITGLKLSTLMRVTKTPSISTLIVPTLANILKHIIMLTLLKF